MYIGMRPDASGHQEAGHTVPALTNRRVSMKYDTSSSPVSGQLTGLSTSRPSRLKQHGSGRAKGWRWSMAGCAGVVSLR